jgi:hypothetical protein
MNTGKIERAGLRSFRNGNIGRRGALTVERKGRKRV